MVACARGLEFIQKAIDSEVRDSTRRIKVIHIDTDWIDNHVALKDQIKPLYRIANEERWSQSSETGLHSATHGVSCSAILKSKLPDNIDDPEAGNFWNLAKHCDLRSAPLRNLNSELYSNYDTATLPFEASMARALYEIERLAIGQNLDAEEEKLLPGDIICIPMGLSAETGDIDRGKWHNGNIATRPIIDDDVLETIVKRLTNKYLLTVIVASANGNIDLSKLPAKSSENIRYHNHGTACGAILVGSEIDGNHDASSNYGTCVDAYGPAEAGNMSSITYDDSEGTRTDPTKFPIEWNGTSAATMYIAALIYSIQQLRIIRNHAPCKPYEIRAHLRQWSQPHDFDMRTPCPRVNLYGWAIGTGIHIPGTNQEWIEHMVDLTNS